MQSAWIRGVGFFGAAALLVAACSNGGDAPRSDEPGRRALQITVGGATSMGGAVSVPNAGAGGVILGTGGGVQVPNAGAGGLAMPAGAGVGGASASGSSNTTGGGVGGGKSSSSGSSSTVGVGVGGSSSSGSSSTVGVGVGGSSSTTGVGVGGSSSGGSSSSGGITKLSNGSACLLGTDCQSASCVDGVCCNTACNGTCLACTGAKKGGGLDGVCGNAATMTDPHNDCPDPQLVPCQAPGFCNGNGACAPALPLNAVCIPGSCTASGATPPATCNNQGACIQGMTTPCPLGCLGTLCKTTCAGDIDCTSVGGYCSGGNCVPKAALGGACGGDNQCAVGSCVAGICCDAACSGGPCQTCVKAKGALNDGTCTFLDGPPPAGKCSDGLKCTDDVCSAGLCANPAKTCPAPAVCMATTACAEATGQCGEAPLACPQDGIGECQTRVCDVTSPGDPCVVRSKLDGARCGAGSNAGICVAGSCFTVTGIEGTGGAGAVAATSSVATGASAATGAGGAGVGGGSFHFAGGACNIVNDGKTSLDGDTGRAAWILAAALFAARRRPGRSAISSRRGSRDA